jgi:prepilin-type N-terminal cleavage/methylation domain-containing protein
MLIKKAGFTLLELIVVVAVLAILAAIAVPVFINVKDRAEQGVEISCAVEIANAINLHNADESEAQITSADWAGEADIQAALGDLAPFFPNPSVVPKAITRLRFTGSIASVDTAIN